MNTIDLSIIVTCKNKEAYLDACISSIIDQSVKPKELIIVHDGCDSPMGHAQANTIILGSNHGVSYARNEGFRYSTSRLILFVDADDKLSPDYLEKMVMNLSSVDITYPNVFKSYEIPGLNDYLETPIVTPKLLLKTCPIVISSMMHRRVYETLHGFKDMPVFEDWDFWIRAMAEKFTFKKSQTLLWYRQLPNTRNSQNQEVKDYFGREVLSKYIVKDNCLCLK